MQTHFSLDQLDEVAAAVRDRTRRKPKIAMILGSGLSGMADAVREPDTIPFQELPYFPVATVMGHAGRLLIGELMGQTVMMMQGRIHFYEGYTMAEVTLPVRMMQRLGIEILVVTNAAGAVNPDFEPGDVMLITDHLSFLGMMGHNPLIGPNYDEIGPRFPDMSQAYDRQLGALARAAALEAGIPLREGVYAGLSGPSFEGPADLRFLATCRSGCRRHVDRARGHCRPAWRDASSRFLRHKQQVELGRIYRHDASGSDGSWQDNRSEVGETDHRRLAAALGSFPMPAIYQALGTHEVLVYILLTIGAMFALRWLWHSWREWRHAVYGLEREFALRRMSQAIAAMALILVLFCGELVTASFILPNLPASMLVPTATPGSLGDAHWHDLARARD